MNALIESLNHWGGQFVNFAWPMLWQSSLLIAVVFTLDLLLARKIRAAVRYALWLAVLVKLLLPPALALPTGAAWWLVHAKLPAPALIAKKFTVTDDAGRRHAACAHAKINRRRLDVAWRVSREHWIVAVAGVALVAGFANRSPSDRSLECAGVRAL
jgi:lysylphosphatidylglycerol synthetase-like protein (DUF2156 family)